MRNLFDVDECSNNSYTEVDMADSSTVVGMLLQLRLWCCYIAALFVVLLLFLLLFLLLCCLL